MKIFKEYEKKLNGIYAHNEKLMSYKQTFQGQINELQKQIYKREIQLFENYLKEIELKKYLKEL